MVRGGGVLGSRAQTPEARRGSGADPRVKPEDTRSYSIHRLVWFEEHADIRDAIHMEKRLKKWEQAWKFELIENANPHWDDLWEEVAGSF